MFGAPEENPKGWEKRPLEYGVKLQGGFAFKSNDIKNSGIKLVKISNVGFEKILWDSIEYLPIEFSLKYADFLLHDGDIVMALTRPIIKSLDTIKVAQITKNDTPCLLNQRVARVSVNANIATGIYLLYFFYTQYFKKKVEKFCSTSLQPNISTSQIESIETPFPPLRLQKIFEAKISHILESKRKLSNVLTEELFNKAIEICFKY